MELYDILIYVLDVIIAVIMFRMWKASKLVEVHADSRTNLIIMGIFWLIALVGVFKYSGAFRVIQTIALLAMGAVYYFLKSGLSKDGIVMSGKLYTYEQLSKISIDEANHCVNFTVRMGSTPMYFKTEQMKEVRAYLSKYAGIAKKAVR